MKGRDQIQRGVKPDKKTATAYCQGCKASGSVFNWGEWYGIKNNAVFERRKTHETVKSDKVSTAGNKTYNCSNLDHGIPPITIPCPDCELIVNGNMKVTVDFTKHPKLYEKLMQVADDQFRTVEGQILFELANEVEEGQ